MLRGITIKMLESISPVADGRCVLDAAAKLAEPWQRFCCLAPNREHVTLSSVQFGRGCTDDCRGKSSAACCAAVVWRQVDSRPG